jgi:excisionase family DNA binding protein
MEVFISLENYWRLIMSQTESRTPNLDELPSLLTAKEVARFLKVSRSKAYLLMQQGEIPVVRLGRSVRVRPMDLEEYITKNLEVAGSPVVRM